MRSSSVRRKIQSSSSSASQSNACFFSTSHSWALVLVLFVCIYAKRASSPPPALRRAAENYNVRRQSLSSLGTSMPWCANNSKATAVFNAMSFQVAGFPNSVSPITPMLWLGPLGTRGQLLRLTGQSTGHGICLHELLRGPWSHSLTCISTVFSWP